MLILCGVQMLDITKTKSLTDFKRNSSDHLARLKETGEPELLTVNGEAAIVVQEAGAYQELLRRAASRSGETDEALADQSGDAWRRRFETHMQSIPDTEAGAVDVSRESIYEGRGE